MNAKIEVSFQLNGKQVDIEVLPSANLRDVLRGEGMFSVKFGSVSGETGAAAVGVV